MYIQKSMCSSQGTSYGRWFSIIIDLGAIASLTSGVLTTLLAQSRIFYAMANDGLLPSCFSKVHYRTHTPWIASIIIGS